MPNFCLMPETVTKFKQSLKDGTIDPNKLAGMSSAERNEFLGSIVGQNHAKAVNSLFESKILLKNQQRGYLTWAKQVSGIKPNVRRDLIAKIERMQKVLDPEEGKQFMRDLTSTRLGVDVTEEEAARIADLSKRVSEAESLRRPDKTFPSNEQRLNYGRAVEDLTDYVASLKQDADKIKVSDLPNLYKNTGLLRKFVTKTAGNMKSLQASLDNSSIFRQGWKLMWTDPNIWRKNAAQTFITGAKTVGGKNVLREVNADIISRPNYDKYMRAKLAIKDAEEAFPESLAEKVPAFGRLYKASEAAFTGFQYKNRADVFDKYLQIAKKNGVDIEDTEQLLAIGKLINSLTGRGHLGKLEPIATEVNNIFFSPRFLKSNWDTLTAHQFQKDVTPFVRKKAALNLLNMIGGFASVLAAANTLMPGSVEWDPRSSDFGKIRVGDTRFDVSGGMSSLTTILARLSPTYDENSDSEFLGLKGWGLKSKSATTGKITDINSGDFNSKTWDQVVLDFFKNKLSPAAATASHLYEGKDHGGNDTNIGKEAVRSVTPISIQNAIELFSNPNAADPIIGVIADGLGIGTSTYSASGSTGNPSWVNSKNKQLQQFKVFVGEDKFKEEAKSFDTSFNKWMDQVMDNPTYQKMTTDEKSGLILKKKSQLQKDIFKSNGFKYKKDSNKKTDESLL